MVALLDEASGSRLGNECQILRNEINVFSKNVQGAHLFSSSCVCIQARAIDETDLALPSL